MERSGSGVSELSRLPGKRTIQSLPRRGKRGQAVQRKPRLSKNEFFDRRKMPDSDWNRAFWGRPGEAILALGRGEKKGYRARRSQ